MPAASNVKAPVAASPESHAAVSPSAESAEPAAKLRMVTEPAAAPRTAWSTWNAEASHKAWWRRPAVTAAAWLLTMLACVAAAWISDYQVHDADSKLYADMARELAARPFAQWCAPLWNGHWSRQGLFYEHPPGLLWAGAAMVRAHVPATQAMYIVNFTSLFASLGLLYGIGWFLGGRMLGWMAVSGWALTPAFLQYLIRGSQEHPLTCALLLGLIALVMVQQPLVATMLWSLALTAALFFKGLAGLALLAIGGGFWLLCDRRLGRLVQGVLGSAIALLAAILFDVWYQNITGTSFWQHYLQDQVLYSVGHIATWSDKLGNLAYYTARPLWYAAPLMLPLCLALCARLRGETSFMEGRAWQLGWIVTGVFVLGFSLANRKADRYIFPMYPALALAAGWAALTLSDTKKFRLWFRRHLAVVPYALMLLILAGVGIKIYMGTYHYHFIRWWPGA